MADSKITALTALTTLTDTDVFPVVDDPSGTPVTKKISALTIKNYVQSLLGSTGVQSYSNTVAASSTAGTVVTGGVANTKGAYAEIIAATPFEASTMIVNVQTTIAVSGNATGTLLDIAVGAAASEVDFISNIAVGYRAANVQYVCPITVPAGVRISARLQGQVASQAATVNVMLRESGDHSAAPNLSYTYGAVPAASVGTVPAAAASINTKSAYAELTAATVDATINRLLVVIAGTGTAAGTAATGLVDIAVGGAAAETVIIPDIYYESTANELWTPYGTALSFTVSIPPVSRLSCRYQATSTATGARPAVLVIGFV